MISIALIIPIACQVWARGIAKKDIPLSIGIAQVGMRPSAKRKNGFQKSKMIPKI
jgi:hypothetical protein